MAIRNKILTILVVLILFFVQYGWSQSDEYGIGLQKKYASLTKGTYPEDAYICLLTQRSVILNRDGSYSISDKNIYKVLKEDARFILGEQKIQFNAAFERIVELEAWTISPSGEIEKATQIQELSPYSGFPLYSSNKIKILSLPGVVEGAIVEIKSHIEGKKILKGEFWDEWFFKYDVPVLECSYAIKLPVDKKIYISEYKLGIKPKIQKSKDGKFVIYRWVMRDIKKYKSEDMSPPYGIIAPQLAVSTIDSWDRLGRLLWELYKDKFIPDKMILDEVLRIIKGKKTDMEQLKSILKYLQDNFRYVSLSLGNHALEPHLASETFNNKYGDCKDQCVLLACMLRAIGIESDPVLVHYPFFYLHRDSPSPSYFNHMVLKVKIGNEEIFVDPLLERCSPKDMQLSLDNTDLFIFNENGVQFINPPEPDVKNYTEKIHIKIAISPDGSAHGEIVIFPERVTYPIFRAIFSEIYGKRKEEFTQEFISRIARGGRIEKLVYPNPDNYDEPFYIKMKFLAPDFVVITGEYIILQGMQFGNTKLFSKKERILPIFSHKPICRIMSYEYILPEGYQVEYLPESYSYESPLDSFSTTYKIVGNKIIVEHRGELKKVELPPSKYKQIQQLYNKLANEGKKKIILKKSKANLNRPLNPL